MTQFKIMQLTHDNSGHTIHNTQCFSQDDEWIVYDTRNNDAMIASTENISMVKYANGEIRELYQYKASNTLRAGSLERLLFHR
jgi:hypothetical protein